uniref:PRA1 family protein n=1 Tax=Riptortus pedestris TaxID=329032 RepID=R4WDS1_RIPPE|nr:prenylated rab acceptor [Riptortus pedestris]
MFLLLRLTVLLILGASFIIMTDVVLDVSGKITPQEIPRSSNFTGFPKSFSLPALRSWFQQCREGIKPWGLFINTSHFKVPPNIPRLLKRAVNNLSYFQGNYLVITLILMAYCLLTSPLLLLSVIASLVACYMLSLRNNEKKLVISGREVSLNQQYAAVGICSLPLYYWAGVGQAVFWVIGASCFVISIHAGLFNIDEVLSQEEQLELLVQQI